ncbi:DDX1 [Mytilus edulis]|uniref:DDX1 n=1 Tax=Mytilus edulis TaxID=6550 RepID=A0A8S3QHQ3_MYTED|nr:DDX1 [Mytilus edulis]
MIVYFTTFLDEIGCADLLEYWSDTKTLSEAIKILKGEYVVTAIDEHNMDAAIIFCRTKVDCDNLERYLGDRGRGKYSCVCLHGDRKPQERKGNLEKFKQKKVRFLICTDVAARGLDISKLPYVINVTLPDEKQNYIHRIGRVGRAERMGLAISLVGTVKEKLLSDIQEHLDITIDSVQPDMKVAINEFDGKVTYGQRRKVGGGSYKGHIETLAPSVKELAELEKRAQTSVDRFALTLHQGVWYGVSGRSKIDSAVVSAFGDDIISGDVCGGVRRNSGLSRSNPSS